MTVSVALRGGFRRALSKVWPALALFLVGSGEVFAGMAAPLVLLDGFQQGDGLVLSAGMLALFAGWVGCRAARAVILYAAFGEGPARALGYFGLSTMLELTVRLWWWTGMLASLVAYLHEAGRGAAAGPSLALSVTLSGGVLLALFATVWSDLALARSTIRGEPFSASLAASARMLAERPGPPVTVVLVTGLIRWMVEMGGSSLAAMAGAAGSPAASLWARVIAGLLAALAWAVLELSRVCALQALDAEPPPAPPTPAPEPARPVILDAVPVDAPESPR
ncbi:MAG TPA: hypothetical protein VFA20_03870 [Myxococcaceae bacterium]|nr:hypothetical protein [Myxococcaceae bacterium]